MDCVFSKILGIEKYKRSQIINFIITGIIIVNTYISAKNIHFPITVLFIIFYEYS